MSFDALDRQTVNSFPKLSKLHASYGVRVNALSVEEIFSLYERTGFLYPEKAARLIPHLWQVRENWRRMLRGGESLLYVLTAGDEKRGCASLAVWRTTLQGWMSQHLVSENNPLASRAVNPPVCRACSRDSGQGRMRLSFARDHSAGNRSATSARRATSRRT